MENSSNQREKKRRQVNIIYLFVNVGTQNIMIGKIQFPESHFEIKFPFQELLIKITGGERLR